MNFSFCMDQIKDAPEDVQRRILQGLTLEHQRLTSFKLEALELAHFYSGKQVKVLIIDVSQRAPSKNTLSDGFQQVLAQDYYCVPGPDDITDGELFRWRIGFERDDDRYTIWHPDEEPDFDYKGYDPSFVITTGGGAMVSEIEGGGLNKDWLLCAVRALSYFYEQEIPAFHVCLGHQIMAFSQGGVVGPCPFADGKREVGAVTLEWGSVRHLLLCQNLDLAQPIFMQSHVEAVGELPGEDVRYRKFAYNGHGPFQGIIYFFADRGTVQSQRQVENHRYQLTTQFHPELGPLSILGLSLARNEQYRREGIDPWKDISYDDTPLSDTIFRNLIRWIAGTAPRA